MHERLYDRSSYRHPRLATAWSDHVHLIDDPLALTLLARLCARETGQPEVGRLVRRLYEQLAWIVVAEEFPRKRVVVPTRMVATNPEAVYRGVAIDRSTKAVTVGIARAGTVPSQILYETLNEVLDPAGVRQDHLIMSRVTDAEGRVVGTEFLGAKAGSDVHDRYVLLPDPMGATGSSMSEAVQHYKTKLNGEPAKVIAMHLIVTPEYLRRMQSDHPDVHIYALRYDRGLSQAQAFAKPPGGDETERGLTDNHYIVPGAGGLGEILNNTWV